MRGREKRELAPGAMIFSLTLLTSSVVSCSFAQMSASLHLKSIDLPDRLKRPESVLLIGILAVCIFVVALPFILHMAEYSYLYYVLAAPAAVIVALQMAILIFIVTLPKASGLNSPFEVLNEVSPARISFSPFIPFYPPRYCATV